ncbi:uncharacterized protein [Primulina huaijiensis]|uniref:uncharacterized protein n=1 Tax=Primulina huaijiensis TaxID=1492673 RepID=UPI003CC76B2C
MELNQKADERVEWNYLCAVMSRIGFSDKWIDRIWDYCFRCTYSDLLTRELRKGCPLSPHLFLLRTQGLSSLIRGSAIQGNIWGYLLCEDGPGNYHLLFADDTGQMINIQKSSITFRPNKTCEMKVMAFNTLEMNHVESHEAYLGLSAFVGRSKKEKFRQFEGKNVLCWWTRSYH